MGVRRTQQQGTLGREQQGPSIINDNTATAISDLSSAASPVMAASLRRNVEGSNIASSTSSGCQSSSRGASRGRPKGTTKKQKQETAAARASLVNEAALEYSANLDSQAGDKSRRLPRGHLKKLVALKREQLKLPDNINISLKTVLPITSATGEPVVCVIIFASERDTVEPTLHTGIDITVDPILTSLNEVDLKHPENYGPTKYFPSGPVCVFRGKQIQTLVFSSPSASISGEILVKIFTALDEIELYHQE